MGPQSIEAARQPRQQLASNACHLAEAVQHWSLNILNIVEDSRTLPKECGGERSSSIEHTGCQHIRRATGNRTCMKANRSCGQNNVVL